MEEGYRSIQVESNDTTAFNELSTNESLLEMKTFLEAVTIPRDGKTIFRSDHASNYLVLKGRLGRDKERLLAELQEVLDGSDEGRIRPEWMRGL